MRVLSSVYWSSGGVEPVLERAVRLRVCAPHDCAAAEGCDALVATGVVPDGEWR
jgi:hypothetical protein